MYHVCSWMQRRFLVMHDDAGSEMGVLRGQNCTVTLTCWRCKLQAIIVVRSRTIVDHGLHTGRS